MKYLLIKMDGCWADEFDVESLWVTTEDVFEDWKKTLLLKYVNEDKEVYFGTNEWIYFDSVEDILSSLSVIEIDSNFYNKFIEYIGEEFGLISISSLPNYYDNLEDLEEVEEEEWDE